MPCLRMRSLSWRWTMPCWASCLLKSLISCSIFGSVIWSRKSRTQVMKNFSPGGKMMDSESQKRDLKASPPNQYLGMSPSRPKLSFSRGMMGCCATGVVIDHHLSYVESVLGDWTLGKDHLPQQDAG